MDILALDPSSKAIGWALADRAGTRSGLFHPLDWRAKAQERDARHRHMCGRAGEWLADMITAHAPSVVVMETGGGRPGRKAGLDACSERLRGALFLVTYTREVLTQTVHPSTWQAWARHNLTA